MLANASNQDQQRSSNRGTGGFWRNRFFHNRQRGRGWPNQSGDNNLWFILRSVSTDQQDTACLTDYNIHVHRLMYEVCSDV